MTVSCGFKPPKCIVAPMVDHSELAWRILSRRYGAQLCFTPMFHARLFSEQESYRKENFVTNPQDRPLIVQFCANDPEYFVKAAKLVENDCDAVDLNLGCPQHIAKRGHYGSYLMEDWKLIERMVSQCVKAVKVPVTCKIRIFPDVEKTIEYAKMIERAGCQMLTVHGRTRDQKGHNTGLADWEQIRRVKEALNIPVVANGNILYMEDVDACIKATGVDGVMTAAIFTGKYPTIWEMAQEYLDIVLANPNSANNGMVKAHLFKIFKPCLSTHTDIRSDLGKASKMEEFLAITAKVKERMYQESIDDPIDYEKLTKDENGFYKLPIWVCQPYLRPMNPEVLEQRKLVQDGEQPAKKAKRIKAELLCSSCKVNMASARCPSVRCKSCCQADPSPEKECDQHKKQ